MVFLIPFIGPGMTQQKLLRMIFAQNSMFNGDLSIIFFFLRKSESNYRDYRKKDAHCVRMYECI